MSRIREALEEAREWVAECAGKRFVVSTINPSELLAKIDAALASPAGEEIGVKADSDADTIAMVDKAFEDAKTSAIVALTARVEASRDVQYNLDTVITNLRNGRTPEQVLEWYEQRIRSALTVPVPSGEWEAGIEAAAKAEAKALSMAAGFDLTEAREEYEKDLTDALLRFRALRPASAPEDLYRHKKRGTTYRLLGIGKMQAEWWRDSLVNAELEPLRARMDMAPVAIYRSESDGSLWVRPKDEFEDGRFEKVASAPEDGGAK